MPEKTKVYISYSWITERDTMIVEELQTLCSQSGIALIRDNQHLQHGESITQFMDKISKGSHIITVFSDPYFHSTWCMYELLRTYQRGEFSERTHPIVANDDCKLLESTYRLGLVKYWQETFQFEDEKIKAINDPLLITKEQERVKIIRDILQNISDILIFAADRLTTPLSDLKAQNYRQLLNQIVPNRAPDDNDAQDINREDFTPDQVAAWINRKNEWDNHIIERIRTRPKAEKAIAFIISGVEEEWPEAFKLRVCQRFKIPHKKDVEIRPRFTGKFETKKECGLWYSILEKIVLNRIELETLETHKYEDRLVSELAKTPESQCFFWIIGKEAKKQTQTPFLKDMVGRWQALEMESSSQPHFLFIINVSEKMKWLRRGQQDMAKWHSEMKSSLKEKSQPGILVRQLGSPDKGDIDTWLSDYHPDKSDIEKINKAFNKKMWWGKAPHLTLLETYMATIKKQNTGV